MATIDEKVLWGAAEKLRDKCDPADYKNVVLGLVFLKYVSDRYMAKYNALVKEAEEVEEGFSLQEDKGKEIALNKNNVFNIFFIF